MTSDPKPPPSALQMDMRDYVAIQMLPKVWEHTTDGRPETAVREAFQLADAFMAERAERAKGAKP